jgi:lipopolysaccharide transport system ATP-binding protein
VSPALRTTGLGKLYRVGPREPYAALRDRIVDVVRLRRRPRDTTTMWAVKDVTFDVRAGEVVGIIGRNGAGKSTLLKLLARITWPTEGGAEVHGRVGSLLDVGAGFHPELSGRENVYLNGAVLGMSRAEIRRKFDAIVAFSEVEEFLETPLKHYSSGMHVRLAFAIAAHLEPEILFIDEVLALGDLRFQRKCLGRMDDVARGGRTILFVSHQLNQIRRLCSRVIWLDGGRVRLDGPTAEVTAAYESAMVDLARAPAGGASPAAAGKAAFVGWTIDRDRAEGPPHVLDHLGPLRVSFLVDVTEPLRVRRAAIALYDAENRLLWGAANGDLALDAGRHALTYALPSLPLRPGSYVWKVSLFDDAGLVDVYDSIPPLLVATEPLAHPADEWAGFLNLPYELTTTRRD